MNITTLRDHLAELADLFEQSEEAKANFKAATDAAAETLGIDPKVLKQYVQDRAKSQTAQRAKSCIAYVDLFEANAEAEAPKPSIGTRGARAGETIQ